MTAVRILSGPDAAAYAVLRLDALRTEPAAFGSSHDTEAAFTAAQWEVRVAPPGGACFGVDSPDGLVATGAVITDGDHPDARVLVAMWTDPAHRGLGHGRRIVEAAIAFARGAGATRITCSVTVGNDTAEKLYASCGFARTGVVETRPSDGLTHAHMELRF